MSNNFAAGLAARVRLHASSQESMNDLAGLVEDAKFDNDRDDILIEMALGVVAIDTTGLSLNESQLAQIFFEDDIIDEELGSLGEASDEEADEDELRSIDELIAAEEVEDDDDDLLGEMTLRTGEAAVY